MKKMNFKITLSIVALIVLTMVNCHRTPAEKDFDANSALIGLVMDTAGESEAQKLCKSAVTLANTCIGAGSGFDYYNSCHDTYINTNMTTTDWNNLITKMSGAIQETACNLPDKKYQKPSQATADGAAFNSTVYTKEVTTTSGTTTTTTTFSISDLLKGRGAYN